MDLKLMFPLYQFAILKKIVSEFNCESCELDMYTDISS